MRYQLRASHRKHTGRRPSCPNSKRARCGPDHLRRNAIHHLISPKKGIAMPLGRWFIYFVGGAIAFMAFVLLVLWASNGFEDLGIRTVGLIALIIGSLLTTALGIALMGL